MNAADQHRIAKRHLERSAIVYVRQSDPRQVRENTESTLLQRGLRERAIEMGWMSPKVIEDDLGVTASGFAERAGFQWMLTQITLRKVGIIFCIEASRLSRNSPDWTQLFQLCGYFDTLIADVQQVYDVSIPNDRLVLQIKGTVAELELSTMKARLRAGLEAKAARGELKVQLPPGFIYGADDQMVMDPDARVQQAIRSMFEKFEQATSVRQLAMAYHDAKIPFPVRKPGKRGLLVWELPQSHLLHQLLSHPIYAGVYTRGRTQSYVDYSDGKLLKRSKRVSSPEDWSVCIKGHHDGYITWERYQENLAKLAEARPRWNMADNRCAVREGRALLAGLLRCGHCGRKLRVIYNRASSAMYHCDGEAERCTNRCLSFGGKCVDEAIGDQLCQALEPLSIEAAERAFALEQQEREKGIHEARLRLQAAQYVADRAFEQFDLADPKNRLVVENLEKRLNEKLAEVRAAKEALEQSLADDPPLSSEQREQLNPLSQDFRRVWNHSDTPTTLRKQLLRAALCEVVARRDGEELSFTVHWVGGTCTQVVLKKRATPAGSRTDPSLAELVRKLAESLGDGEIARILNMKKVRTPRDLAWTQDRVQAFRFANHIKQTKPVADPNVLTGLQARAYLGIGYGGLMALLRRGLIHTNQVTDFAPWRLQRAELDSARVQAFVKILKANGRAPPEGGFSEVQELLFPENTATPRKGAL
jgi:DNA invertase Pin-like site-specific DNA recombinase